MKNKIIFMFFLLSTLILMQFIFINSVNASEFKIFDADISYEIKEDGTVRILQLADNENWRKTTILNVPESIEGKKVTEVGGFQDSSNLTTVNLPNGITKITMNAFRDCKKLTTINLPNTITEIGDCAFEGCTSLKSIVLPEKLEILEGAVFHNCIALTDVTLPKNLQKIDFYIETLKYRGYGAFEGCTSLKKLTLPNSLKIIAHAAFEGTGFTTLTLSNSINTIDTCLFYGCDNLTTLRMPASIETIQQYAFGGCPNLKELYFPKNIKTIDDKIFDYGPDGYSITPKGATDLNKLTIYGYAGTVAETFAKEKGIKFVALTDEPVFKDVKTTDWFYNATEYCSQNSIITGYEDGRFAPNDKLSRAMLVTILYKMEGQPKVTGTSKFPDVQNSKQYYYNAVIWASNNGIVSGYNNGNFGTSDNITREDLAVILNRYAKYKGKNVNQTNDLKGFTDTNKISSYAKTQIQWAVGAGVITGNKDKTLNPKGQSTRAEAAAMIEKYCKRVGK